MGVADLIFSSGWLHQFEKCYGLSQHVKYGETADKTQNSVNTITAKETQV
jgi:hypothetical protein